MCCLGCRCWGIVLEQALAGDFEWLPDVRYVDSEVLGDANGAYDAQSQTILINASLQGNELAARTFIEEAAHHLDTLLKRSDTTGDEGEMFRRMLGSEILSEIQVQAIRNEDDTGTIMIDGKEAEVEFWSVKKAFNKHIREPFKKHVSDPIKERVVEPLVRLGQDAIAVANDLVLFNVLDLPGAVLNGANRVRTGLYSEGLKGGLNALKSEIHSLTSSIGHQVVDSLVMASHSVVKTVEGLLGTLKQRKLNTDEIASLKLLYRDTINYSEVRIQTGGIKEALKYSANVVGNDVFMPEKYLDGNGGLTQQGTETLLHELAHVWQYQNRGPAYISESLQAQRNEGHGSVGTGKAYDWLVAATDRGETFDQMNTESQSELAMYIGLAILKNTNAGSTELTYDALQEVIREKLKDSNYALPTEVFVIAAQARDILRGIAHAPAAAT